MTKPGEQTTKHTIDLVTKKAFKIVGTEFEKRPAYYMIASGRPQYGGEQGFDGLHDLLYGGMGKTAGWLFRQLIIRRDEYSNYSKFKANSRTEANMVAIGYKELHQHGLVLRIRQQLYFINPRGFIPKKGFIDKAAEWDTRILLNQQEEKTICQN